MKILLIVIGLLLFTSPAFSESPIPSRVLELEDEPAEFVTQIGDVLHAECVDGEDRIFGEYKINNPRTCKVLVKVNDSQTRIYNGVWICEYEIWQSTFVPLARYICRSIAVTKGKLDEMYSD